MAAPTVNTVIQTLENRHYFSTLGKMRFRLLPTPVFSRAANTLD